MKGGRETETKLAAWAGFSLPDLTGVLEGVTSRPFAERVLEATYYDTVDLRLARWGASLRYRTGDGTGWTVKLPDGKLPDGKLPDGKLPDGKLPDGKLAAGKLAAGKPADGKLAGGDAGPALVRREITFPAQAAGSIPVEAGNLVSAYSRTEPLVASARLRTRRRGVELFDAEGQRLAEVVDDEVSVFEGRHLASRFRELEVEVDQGADPELMAAVVEALRAAGAGEVEPIPKVVRALGARARQPPELVPQNLPDDATAADVVRSAITTSVIRILRHDAGVRIGDDPEDVHQERVGTRRLRSDLKTFKSLLDPEWLDGMRTELRWLGGALGMVRDADVLLERLHRQAALLAEADAPGAATVVRRLVNQREAGRADLLESMSGPRYVELLDRLVEAAQAPPLLPEADQKATDILPDLVRKPWKKLAKAVEALGDPPVDEELHNVRIQAKACRYAVEAVAPVMGKPATVMAKAVAEVQGVLGDHQDAVVAEGWLREAAESADVNQLVVGELIALERVEADVSRREWWYAWRQAREPRLRKWLK